jgi:hypothetical protein
VKNRLKKYLPGMLIIVAILMIGACTAGPNPATNTASTDGAVAGFWLGWWHGVITPITFIISIFEPTVKLYEVHNNGAWYDLGFVLGAGLLFSGGSATATYRRRRGDED